MVEIVVRNTDRKLRVDDDIADKLRELDLRYYRVNKKGHVGILTQDKKWVRLSSYLAGGNNRTIKYKDGDSFNITKDNMILASSHGIAQVRDDINNTISFRGKLFKFDREDFELLDGYSLAYVRHNVAVTTTAKLAKKTGKHQTLSLKKLLFNTPNVIVFKNGDDTDYRRSNIEINTNKKNVRHVSSITTTIVKDKYKGVKAYKDLYIIRETSNPNGIYVKCSYIEAAMVYNYLRRTSGRDIKYINYTGYSEEEENKIAEDILKNHSHPTNATKYINATSNYLGVSWNTDLNRWMCKGTFLGQRYYLGVYMEEKEAAKAYNKKAIEMLGKHAKLNTL